MDNGSSIDILNLLAYQQMKLDKEKLHPMDAPLVGFTWYRVGPVGIVSLPIMVKTYPKKVLKTVDFLVVDCPSAYNAIIGRPTFNKLHAITSTYHLVIKFLTKHGIREVRGDQVEARECHLASLGTENHHQALAIEEGKAFVKLIKGLETVHLDDNCHVKMTKIRAKLSQPLNNSIIQFLKANKDVCAWSHEDMPGINPKVVSHKLNVDQTLCPVKQKRRFFAPDMNAAIIEEVDKLLVAKLIREVFYLEWLTNVVMVNK